MRLIKQIIEYQLNTHSLAEILQVLIGPVLFSTVFSFFIFRDRKKYKLSKSIVFTFFVAFVSGFIAILNFVLVIFVIGLGNDFFYYSVLIELPVSILSFSLMTISILISDIHQKDFKLTKSISVSILIGSVVIYALYRFVVAFFGSEFGLDIPAVDEQNKVGVRNVFTGDCSMYDFDKKLPFWLEMDNSCFYSLYPQKPDYIQN